MIVTKASLSAVKVARRDKDLPVLDNVRIEKDGTTVACARNIVLAISPPAEARAAQAPVTSSGPLDSDITVPSEWVKGVLKEVKTDKTFDGLLEYVDVEKTAAGAAFRWVKDGEPQAMYPDLHSGSYIDYRKVFARSLTNRSGIRLKMNRVRLKALVDTLDKVAPDNGEAPVYIEFTETGDMIMRATNDKTGQRAVAVMTHFSERGDDWLDPDEWERGLCDEQENSKNVGVRRNVGNASPMVQRRTVENRAIADLVEVVSGSERADDDSVRGSGCCRRSVLRDNDVRRPKAGARIPTARRPCRRQSVARVSQRSDGNTSGGSGQARRHRTVRSSRTDVRSSTGVRRVDARTESGTKPCARVARRERKR